MDFRFTPKEETLRKEFDDFFAAEMKNAPRHWSASMEAIFSEECWDFFREMAKKLGDQRVAFKALAQAVWWGGCSTDRAVRVQRRPRVSPRRWR